MTNYFIEATYSNNKMTITLSKKVMESFKNMYLITLFNDTLTKTQLINETDNFVDIFKNATMISSSKLSISPIATIKVANDIVIFDQEKLDGLIPCNLSIKCDDMCVVQINNMKIYMLSIESSICNILGEIRTTFLSIIGGILNNDGKIYADYFCKSNMTINNAANKTMYIKSMNLINVIMNNNGILITDDLNICIGTFCNIGTWNHSGNFKSKSLEFNNQGLVEWNNVKWNFDKSHYNNNKTWIFDNVIATDEIIIQSCGLLHFKNSMLHFSQLIGNNTIFSSGQYRFDKLQNQGLISFIENEWFMTDNPERKPQNYLYVKHFGPVGKIESEKTFHYGVCKFPDLITACQDIYLTNKYTLDDLVKIHCSATVHLTLDRFNPSKNMEINTINCLKLTIDGNVSITKSFKALGLNLIVNGNVTIGSSNTDMGTLIATKNALVILAHKLDNRFGKIYGKSGVSITASKGDILNGTAISKGPFLYGLNGSYIASGDYMRINTQQEFKNHYGQVFSQNTLIMEVSIGVSNIAGEILSGGDIHFRTPNFTNTRDSTYIQHTANWTWAYSGCYDYCESSDQAYLRALGDIHFNVNTALNLASTIIAQKKIIYKGQTTTQPSTFSNQSRTNLKYGCNDKIGYQSVVCSVYHSTLKSGESIQIDAGNFIIAGNTSSPIITITANSGSFPNTEKYRKTVNHTETIFIDMTQFIQSHAKTSGLLKLTDKGAVIADFENNKPNDMNTVFNPLANLSSSMFDLFIQSSLSEIAGKVNIKNYNGMSLSKRLWENASKFQELVGNLSITRDIIKNTSDAMLIKEINEFQQNTILCVPPSEINPYQSPGDISANEFSCETIEDQVHLNNRIVARDLLKIVSENGNIIRKTESYVVTNYTNDSIITEDVAMPTQTLVCTNGNVNITAHKNISSVGTYTEGTNINEIAKTGKITSEPLILQKVIESKHEKDDGFLSTTTVTNRQTTYSAVQSVTKSEQITHKKADQSISQTASHDIAGNTLIYEAKTINISASIMANKIEHTEETSGPCSDKLLTSSEETPAFFNASIMAPTVQIKATSATLKGVAIVGEVLEDYTKDGLNLEPLIAEMHYSKQMTIESPLASADVGCKGGYEVMIPTKVSVKKIIRMIENGQIKMNSVEWDKDKIKIIGKFVETTYILKQWQVTWNISKQVIPTEAMIIVSLAISYATMGIGATLSGFTGAMGVSASAGFTTLCNVATISFLQTGDPIAVTKGIFSNNFLRTLAINVAAAGLCSSIGPTTTPTQFVDFAKVNMIRCAVNIPLRVIISKESMHQVARTEIMNGLVDTLAMQMASIIGKGYRTNRMNFMEHKLSHAISGGVAGGLMALIDKKPIKSGILGGAIGAVAGETIGELNPLGIEDINKRLTVSKMMAGSIAMMLNQDVNIAVRTGTIAIEYNLVPCIVAALMALGWTHVVHDTIETYEETGLNDAVDTLIVNGIVMRLANGVIHYGGKAFTLVKGVWSKTNLKLIEVPGRVQSRINLKVGDGRNVDYGYGIESMWKKHGNVLKNNKSQFTITKEQVLDLLQNKRVVQSPIIDISKAGHYVREINTHTQVGKLCYDEQKTNFLTIITDKYGNLVTAYPGKYK